MYKTQKEKEEGAESKACTGENMGFSFEIEDGFFAGYQKLIREVVIPYQKKILGDEIEGVEKSHAIENFKIAAGEATGEFYGMVFQDSDVAKWIEAASYSLQVQYDEKLDKELDDLIALIGRAQEPDGYLDTYFTVKEPDHKWQNLCEAHELYCSGHMMEAAVAHYQATGKDSLLNIMKKNADHICGIFGEGKKRGYPGHPEVELALMRLYDVTGDQKYKEMASFFVKERGAKPNYFVEEWNKRDWCVWSKDPVNEMYHQCHKPVTEQEEAVGHAVRAVYLYSGMADVAREENDEALKKACRTLWNNITQKQMYLTGGIGATGIGEAFTKDYDLPNDTAYAETCASVGLIFFAKRMLEMEKKGSYGDVMEKALYNCVLAGMSLDGKKFFYVNPLQVKPGYSGEIITHKHDLPDRPTWFGCACCPPNVARLLLSLSDYTWQEEEDTIYSHLFIGGTYRSEKSGVVIKTETKYPYVGEITYVVEKAGEKAAKLAIRVPAWSAKSTLLVNGQETAMDIKDGYAYIGKDLEQGDRIVLKLDMTPRKVYANLNISEDAGKTALQRGPLVYCFEGVDNDGNLDVLRADRDSLITEEEKEVAGLGNIPVLSLQGKRLSGSDALYSFERPEEKPYTLTAIPYYMWDNRGLNEMKVWIEER